MAEFRLARSVLLMSGTLSPPEIIHRELGIRFTNLARTSVVKRRCLTFVVETGPTQPLRATSATFSDRRFLSELVNVVLHVSASVPYGILMFFPSYNALSRFREALESNVAYEILVHEKRIIWETNSQHHFHHDLQLYFNTNDKAWRAPAELCGRTGAIMFAVCRGKVSEGIDFPDYQCRAVMVAGVPYAYLGDVFVQTKIKHTDYVNTNRHRRDYESGFDWYESEAFSAVNQAIGRSIRHDNDWAAIVLLDVRYRSKIHRLSRWATNELRIVASFDDFVLRLTKFVSQQTTIDGGSFDV